MDSATPSDYLPRLPEMRPEDVEAAYREWRRCVQYLTDWLVCNATKLEREDRARDELLPILVMAVAEPIP